MTLPRSLASSAEEYAAEERSRARGRLEALEVQRTREVQSAYAATGGGLFEEMGVMTGPEVNLYVPDNRTLVGIIWVVSAKTSVAGASDVNMELRVWLDGDVNYPWFATGDLELFRAAIGTSAYAPFRDTRDVYYAWAARMMTVELTPGLRTLTLRANAPNTLASFYPLYIEWAKLWAFVL